MNLVLEFTSCFNVRIVKSASNCSILLWKLFLECDFYLIGEILLNPMVLCYRTLQLSKKNKTEKNQKKKPRVVICQTAKGEKSSNQLEDFK